MNREETLRSLHSQMETTGHIVGVVAGTGMTAKYAAMGGADMILALSAGKFRLMGRSSFLSFLCYGDSNSIVMDLGTKDLLPIITNKPVIFGLNACDPFISLYEYIHKIKENGFSGISNFPTVGILDGKFREALEEEGNTFEKEVEAIRIANFLNLFSIAFVFDENQAVQMTKAGADVVCAHLGFTKGGYLGATRYQPIEAARILAERVFQACDHVNPRVIKMIYGGPANSPADMQYIYDNSPCNGYIGGSTFDRIPIEQALLTTTRTFKEYVRHEHTVLQNNILVGRSYENNYTDFVKQYISDNYMHKITLAELAIIAHVSCSYLSTRFKNDTGCSFTEYLVRFRINKAEQMLLSGNAPPLTDIARMVGYDDYPQFSKMFKKLRGIPPSQITDTHMMTKRLSFTTSKQHINTIAMDSNTSNLKG